MTLRHPPALATWLLKRFLTSDRDESLLGDLFEEYQTGRPPAWYWRETRAALVVLVRREARGLCSRRAALIILGLTAQSALLLWLMVMSERFRQRCPAPPVLLSGAIMLLACAGLTEAAISLVLWLRSLLQRNHTTPRAGFVRLALVVFAAIGVGGGALSWASTTSCSQLAHAARPAVLTAPARAL